MTVREKDLPSMTVGDLIKELQKFDPDLPVVDMSEGFRLRLKPCLGTCHEAEDGTYDWQSKPVPCVEV